MDKETFTLSRKELRRLKVVESALAGRIKNADAARDLGMSVRQFIRLRGRVAKEGPGGVIHGSRGRTSPRRMPEEKRERVKELLKTKYDGFNDTHATEMLSEKEYIELSRESVRRLRKETGKEAARKRRAPKHRKRRDRKERAGEMVLLDASDHEWLEDRGPRLTLAGAIDDATGDVVSARFADSEDLHLYLDIFEEMLVLKGIPASIYTDKHGVFHNQKRGQSIERELAGEPEITQFGRILSELGVVQIFSLSPQARGRIERLWGTFQDRLVSEMRLAGISTKDEANAFLPNFLSRHNGRFSVKAASEKSDWLPEPKEIDWYLCAKYQRTVGNDNTVRFGGRIIDIPPGKTRLSYAKAKVEVHELRTGEARVVYQGQIIATDPPPEGFRRLKPRPHHLAQFGQLPVALLPTKPCEGCSLKRSLVMSGR